jgi:hypothetical protein
MEVSAKYIVIVLVAFGLLLLSGCSADSDVNTPVNTAQNTAANNGAASTTTAASTSSEPGMKTSFKNLYSYGAMTKYSYRINTNIGGQQSYSDTTYEVTPDSSVAGSAYLQQTTTTTEVGSVITKMWMDNAYRCVQIESTVKAAGQDIAQPMSCPYAGPNADNSQVTLKYIGQEEVNVPAGTYTAEKYEANNVVYWVAKGIAVPVKIVYNDGTTKMVLTSYG